MSDPVFHPKFSVKSAFGDNVIDVSDGRYATQKARHYPKTTGRCQVEQGINHQVVEDPRYQVEAHNGPHPPQRQFRQAPTRLAHLQASPAQGVRWQVPPAPTDKQIQELQEESTKMDREYWMSTNRVNTQPLQLGPRARYQQMMNQQVEKSNRSNSSSSDSSSSKSQRSHSDRSHHSGSHDSHHSDEHRSHNSGSHESRHSNHSGSHESHHSDRSRHSHHLEGSHSAQIPRQPNRAFFQRMGQREVDGQRALRNKDRADNIDVNANSFTVTVPAEALESGEFVLELPAEMQQQGIEVEEVRFGDLAIDSTRDTVGRLPLEEEVEEQNRKYWKGKTVVNNRFAVQSAAPAQSRARPSFAPKNL